MNDVKYLELSGTLTNRIIDEVVNAHIKETAITVIGDVSRYELPRYLNTHSKTPIVQAFMNVHSVSRSKLVNMLIASCKQNSVVVDRFFADNKTHLSMEDVAAADAVLSDYIRTITPDVMKMAYVCSRDSIMDMIIEFFDKLPESDPIFTELEKYTDAEVKELLGSIEFFLKEQFAKPNRLEIPTYKIAECCHKDKELLSQGLEPHFLKDCLCIPTRWIYTFDPFIAAYNTVTKSYVIVDKNKSINFSSNYYKRPKPTESNTIVSDFFSLQGLKDLFEGKIYATDCAIGNKDAVEALIYLANNYHLKYVMNTISLRLINANS